MNIKKLGKRSTFHSQNMFEETSIPPIQDFDIVKEEVVGSSGEPADGHKNIYDNKVGSEGTTDVGSDWDVIIKIQSPETEEERLLANSNKKRLCVGNSVNTEAAYTNDISLLGHPYTKDDLDNALEYLNSSHETVAEVANRFSIPRTTLHDHYVESMLKQGPSRTSAITAEEEAEVNYYLHKMAKIGNLRARRDLPGIVKYVLDKRKRKLYANGKNIPSQAWIVNFLKNHPNILTMVPKHFGEPNNTVAEDSVKQYFTMFEKFLREEHNLNASEFLQPSNGQRIFTCDETGFYLRAQDYDVRPAGERVPKNFYKSPGKTGNLRSVFFCISASGAVLRPVIINKGRNLTNYDSHSEIDNRYTAECSESGWLTPEIFHHWLVNDFEPYISETKIERPVVLLLDSSSVTLNIPSYIYAQENQIILYSLLSDVSHLTQPLELGCYKPIEDNYRAMLNSRVTGPTREADPEIYPYVLMKSLENTDMPSCITSGFRDTGLVPYNIDAIDKTKLSMSNFDDANMLDISQMPQDIGVIPSNNEENVLILRAELHSLREFLGRVETILPPCFIKYYEHKLSLREPVFEHSYLIWKELKRKISEVEKHLAKAKEIQDIKPYISASRAPVKLKSPAGASSTPVQNGVSSPITVKASMKAVKTTNIRNIKSKPTKNKSLKPDLKNKKKQELKTKLNSTQAKSDKVKRLKKRPEKITALTTSNAPKNLKIKDVRVRLSTELPTSIKTESKGDCSVCHKVFGSNKEWIGCDCGSWCHKACVNVSLKLSNEQIRKLDFKCSSCKGRRRAAAKGK